MKAYFYRIRLVASVVAVTILPILLTGMVLLHAAEQALLEEKKQKLIAITQQLDFALPKDYDDLTKRLGVVEATREQKIEFINQALQPLTDRIAAEHPGIGVGYYAADLDAIVTYGPSQEMKFHVGESISPTHFGRMVMESGKPEIAIGEQVRGNIMNAMYPLKRDGKTIGYTWANELMSNIDVQLAGMRRSIYAISGLGCLIAAVASGLMVHRLEAVLEEIKAGLRRLSLDLSFRMRRLAGEPGEISEAINKMAGELQASRTRTETIMQSMDSGVFALDGGGKITSWNEAATKVTGLSAEQVMERAYTDVFADSQPFVEMLSETLAHGKTIRDAEWEYQHAELGLRYVKVGTSIWISPMEQVLGAIVVLDERTEWKRMESRLAQAERLAVIGEWAASIAHEVRNPLTSIKAFAQIIEEELPEDHDNREYTEIIVEEVERLNRFADELLLFSKPNEEANVYIHVWDVINQTVMLMERSAADKGIQVERCFGDHAPFVLASPDLLKQVFLNILINAIQAMPNGGTVEIRTEKDGEHACVHVTNDGQHIAEEHLLSVFEPFYSTKTSGTGLGLAISQRIVHAYGGHIIAQNVPSGVRFTVALPGRWEEADR
ncbi:two-component system sensor histidine kinase AtoS [Brevibacillus choshinensis]|uniref:histidine kinase n=1 Tax=Brevibacillus choshinensis TaxID=54911 RepID=A0ABX7FQ67_BRECH|nr:two-component system sensor histidine kinase AtoS [Brevibacillus choshinensis]QRG68386.1 two-component system sensor histidine kinase AtoS [Brevibacillus choshinensis]